MSERLNESKIMQALDWAYGKAVNGVPGLDTAQELASSYMEDKSDKIAQANSLIRWQNTKAATSGFVTGLGGIITLPVAIPANLASVLFVQVRMIAAIAYIGGYDLNDDRVKSLVYACLLGNSAKEILKEAGIAIGSKMATNFIMKSISGAVLTKINQTVGFRLLTKAGEKGVINLTKTVPILGGIIGGTVDSVTTNTIGNIARNIFIEENVA